MGMNAEVKATDVTNQPTKKKQELEAMVRGNANMNKEIKEGSTSSHELNTTNSSFHFARPELVAENRNG